jgi:hypothetical protein
MAAASHPVRTPSMKYARARRFFRSITTDATKPAIAPAPAIATSSNNCSGPTAYMWRPPGNRSRNRSPDQTTAIAEPEVRADCRDQIEDVVLPRTLHTP